MPRTLRTTGRRKLEAELAEAFLQLFLLSERVVIDADIEGKNEDYQISIGDKYFEIRFYDIDTKIAIRKSSADEEYIIEFNADSKHKEYHVKSLEELRESITDALRTLNIQTLKKIKEPIWDDLIHVLKLNYAVARGVLGSGVNLSPGLRSKLEEVASHAERAYSELFGGQIQLNEEETEMAHSIAEIMKQVKNLSPTFMNINSLYKYTFRLIDVVKCHIWRQITVHHQSGLVFECAPLTDDDSSINILVSFKNGEPEIDDIALYISKEHDESPNMINSYKNILDEISSSIDTPTPERSTGTVNRERVETLRSLLGIVDSLGITAISGNLPLVNENDVDTVIKSNRGLEIIINYPFYTEIYLLRSQETRELTAFVILISNEISELSSEFNYNPFIDSTQRQAEILSNLILREYGEKSLKIILDVVRETLNKLLRINYAFYSGVLASGVPLTSGFQAGTLETLGFITRLYEALFKKPIELTEDEVKIYEHTREIVKHVHDITHIMISDDIDTYEDKNIHITNYKFSETLIKFRDYNFNIGIDVAYSKTSEGNVAIHGVYVDFPKKTGSLPGLFEYVGKLLADAATRLKQGA